MIPHIKESRLVTDHLVGLHIWFVLTTFYMFLEFLAMRPTISCHCLFLHNRECKDKVQEDDIIILLQTVVDLNLCFFWAMDDYKDQWRCTCWSLDRGVPGLANPARPNGWSTTGCRLMLKFVKIHYFYYFSPYFSHYFYAICTWLMRYFIRHNYWGTQSKYYVNHYLIYKL